MPDSAESHWEPPVDPMTRIHYSTNDRTTACSLSPESAIHTDGRDLVAGCQECVAAAAAVPSHCPICDYTFCFCFEAGFAAGLAAALAQEV